VSADPVAGGGPLEGRRVLVLRAREQAPALSRRIRALGGVPVEAPVLSIEPGDGEALGAAAVGLAEGAYALVCLTSPNGVDALASALDAAGVDPVTALSGVTIGCVGPGTAAALRGGLGVEADVVPEVSTTEALGHAVPAGRGRALLARADLANPVLCELVAARGYDPVEVTAYRTRQVGRLPAEVADGLEAGDIDLVAFGSPSTVRAFVAAVGDRPWRARAVSIGPVTTAACRRLGVAVAAEADRHDLDGLVDALARAAGEALTPGFAAARVPLSDSQEGPMAETVYKVIELVGTSTESWEKAASAAVERAGKSLRDLRVAEISQLDMAMQDGKISAYRAKVKVSFKYED